MEEETELPKENRDNSKFWKDSNRLLSFSAMFISAVTLFILIYQTSLATKQFDLEQKQQLASVMPYIQVVIGNWDSEEFTVFVENYGVGPAFIKNIKTHYKDSIYVNTDYPIMVNNLIKEGVYDGALDFYSNLGAGSVIPAGRLVEHMKITKGERPNVHHDIFLTDEVEIEIEYASIYDERWIVKVLATEPVKIKGVND